MRKKTVILGMFDGVHMGHAALFDIARKLREEQDAMILVYTFRNHPTELLNGNSVPLLLTENERMEKLCRMGADDITADEFTAEICDMPPEQFAQTLKTRFSADNVVAGFNYTFGRGGLGKARDLISFGQKFGYDVYIADPVMYDGDIVSSTRIRNAIAQGDVSAANAMTGEAFCMSGCVERCRQVGRTMGYPTANIRNTDKKVLPLFGVYATRTHIGERTLGSITNVGTNPTFGEFSVSIETHILDFDEDIYDKNIKVDFLKFVRGQRKFDSIDELKAQISSDTKNVRLYLGQ